MVEKEIAEREPDYERYIAPQKEFADAVIGIDYSGYGRHLGKQHNVYRVTLSQNKMMHTIGNIDLSLDLYRSSRYPSGTSPSNLSRARRTATGWGG